MNHLESIRGRIERTDESDRTIFVDFFLSIRDRSKRETPGVRESCHNFHSSLREVISSHHTQLAHTSKDYKRIKEMNMPVRWKRDSASASVAIDAVLHKNRRGNVNYCPFYPIFIYVRSAEADMCESRVKFDVEVPRASSATSLRKLCGTSRGT